MPASVFEHCTAEVQDRAPLQAHCGEMKKSQNFTRSSADAEKPLLNFIVKIF